MRPGRPRCLRRIENEPVISYFKPRGVPLSDLDVVLLSLEELEAARLVDLEGLNQEEAAQRMGISRRALWEDLQNARRKIVEALVQGKAIEIKGGHYTVTRASKCECFGCHEEWDVPSAADQPSHCPKCGGNDLHIRQDPPEGKASKGCCKGSGHRVRKDDVEGEDA